VLKIREIIWLAQFVEKIERKHGVTTDEVEQAFGNRPLIHRFERGDVHGEDLYRMLSRTDSGRQLAVFFIMKPGERVLVIFARDMTGGEKKSYGKSKR
jgi:hypothetical protein